MLYRKSIYNIKNKKLIFLKIILIFSIEIMKFRYCGSELYLDRILTEIQRYGSVRKRDDLR